MSYGLNPPVYIDTGGGLGLHRVGYREGNLHIRIAKLAFHAKESPTRTRDEVFNLASSKSWSPVDDDSPADDSSADDGSPAIRTPPNPGLPQ